MNFPSPPPPDDAPLLDWALWYASQGWPVFPCTGKQPLGIAVPHGFHDATCDAAQVRHWWAQWPAANIGMPIQTGEVVFDIDPRTGGDTLLYTLQREHGQLPDTLTTQTGGGGQHLKFTSSVPVKNKANIGDGIDVQGVGSYVIMPPSIHPETGRRYLWDAVYGPESITPQPAPAWLEALIVRQGTAPATSLDPQAPILRGTRETTLMRLAGAMQRHGASFEAIRNALEAENARCVPPLDAQALDRMTRSVGRYASTPQLQINVPEMTSGQRGGDNTARISGLKILQAYWHQDITGAWRSGAEPAIWWICLGAQEVCLGSTLKLQDQKHLRACLLEATGSMPPVIPPKRAQEWDTCLMALAEIATRRHEPELDPRTQAMDLVRSYLDAKPYQFRMDFDDDEWKGCAHTNQPFRRDGLLYVHCRQWHNDYLRHCTDLTYAQAIGLLREIGINTVIQLSRPRTNRCYWHIPADLLFDAWEEETP